MYSYINIFFPPDDHNYPTFRLINVEGLLTGNKTDIELKYPDNNFQTYIDACYWDIMRNLHLPIKCYIETHGRRHLHTITFLHMVDYKFTSLTACAILDVEKIPWGKEGF